jgi:hypothetical protein
MMAGARASQLSACAPPRGFAGMQQDFTASCTWRLDHQSLVHSQTLPIMS